MKSHGSGVERYLKVRRTDEGCPSSVMSSGEWALKRCKSVESSRFESYATCKLCKRDVRWERI